MKKIMKKDKLLVYWCAGTNFGDELNRYIWLKGINKQEVVLTAFKNAEIVGCGSILEDLIVEDHKKSFSLRLKMLPQLKIISTGMDFHRNIDYSQKFSFKRKCKIYALRGKKSAEMIAKLTKEKINLNEVVLADGGLLADKLITDSNRNAEKEFELGIVPHYMEKQDLRFFKLAELVPGSILLDVDKNPIEFINKMARCKRIASSALHPLIAADALHIPNIWIRASQKVTSIEKYEDYYSAFGMEKNYITIDSLLENKLYTGKKCLTLIDNSMQVPSEKINQKKEQLMKILEMVENDIKKDEKSLFWKIHFLLLELHGLWKKLKKL